MHRSLLHLISDRTLDTSLASRSLSRLSVVWCMSCALSTSLLKPASREMPSSTDCRRTKSLFSGVFAHAQKNRFMIHTAMCKTHLQLLGGLMLGPVMPTFSSCAFVT